MLRLQSEAVALTVGPAAGAVQGAVEEVSAVELQSRLGGVDGELASTAWVRSPGRELEAVVRVVAPVQYPVVVVSAPIDDLLEVGPVARPDRRGPREVHRRAGHPVDRP